MKLLCRIWIISTLFLKAPALLKPWELGLDPISDKELNSMKYVIYCVGKAIGIDEDMNLCNGDLTETQMYSKLILDHIIKVG